MADKLMYKLYIHNDDAQKCRILLAVEELEHSTYWTNQSKSNESLQSSYANELENVIIKL